jgi:hypothetical protein
VPPHGAFTRLFHSGQMDTLETVMGMEATSSR